MSHDSTPQDPPVPPLWSDEIERLIRRNESLDTMCHDLEREVSRLLAELAERAAWEPVENGFLYQSHHGGDSITGWVRAREDRLTVSNTRTVSGVTLPGELRYVVAPAAAPVVAMKRR